MTWTVTREDPSSSAYTSADKTSTPKLHVRAIIDIDNEQAEIKELIASLQKHVKPIEGMLSSLPDDPKVTVES